MNLNLKEIQENLPDYAQFVAWFNQHTYTNTSLEKCQRWELREALSYYFSDVEPNAITKHVVKSLLTETSLDWTNRRINIVDEAKIQHTLRKHNIEVVGVDQWPRTSAEFAPLTNLISIPKQIKYRIIDNVLQSYERINFNWVTNHQYLIFFIVASLVFGDWTMFVQGILLGYVVWIFLDVLRHEYIEHGYLKLRWSILDIPFRWISYHLSPALYHDDLISTNHTLHHSKWKTSSDELTKRVKQEFIPGFLDYDLGFLSQPKNVNQLSWPYKYYIEFKIILLVILSIEYGFANVFYYALLPLSITGFLQLQHDYYIRWLGERDHPWMFFLAYNQAWHYSHHISYKKKPNLISDLFMGPSWVKYINPQYYFTLIFFKLNSSVSGQ